ARFGGSVAHRHRGHRAGRRRNVTTRRRLPLVRRRSCPRRPGPLEGDFAGFHELFAIFRMPPGPFGQSKDDTMRVYYDRDADLNLIKGRKVAIIGYGSQGHAHALNLRDSGVKNVVVALRKGSQGVKKAEGEKLKVMEVADAAKWPDIMMMLTPDGLQADIYRDHIPANMKEGGALMFAHGLNIHFNLIEPRADLDVMMIAPKGPGHTVRAEYDRGAGVPVLMAIHRDVSGNA